MIGNEEALGGVSGSGRASLVFSEPPFGLLPIGIPMGRLATGDTQQFAVRRGDHLFLLTTAAYQLWVSAHSVPARSAIAKPPLRADSSSMATLDALLDTGLLVDLVGQTLVEDWERLRKLRVVPRAIATGTVGGNGRRFQITSPSGRVAVQLDAQSYVLWSFWNGWNDLERSVDLAHQVLGGLLATLIDRCQALVVSSTRVGMIFVDRYDGRVV